MKTLLPIVLGLAAPVLAQSAPWQGFLFNWNKPALASHISQYTRFNTGAESNLNRIDRDDHKSWGENAAGNVVIRGLAVWIFDTNYATAETFSFVGHAEDAANPNFPLATPAFTVAGIPMPPGTAGNAFLVNGTINVDVTIPGAGDVFVGIGVPAMPGPTQPFDGLFVGTVLRGGVGLAVFDEPGPRGQQGAVGGVAQDDYICGILNGTPQYLPAGPTSLSQLAIDVAINNGGIGGVALTETVQTSLLSSNAPFGTSDFLSGLHPDINGLQAGRADNIGFGITHHVGQMPAGTPVLVQLALGASPAGPLQINALAGFDPVNSGGTLCIDFTAAVEFFTITAVDTLFATMATAQIMVPVPAGLRAQIAGLGAPVDFWWQAFAIDFSNPGPNLEVRASGCVVQHLN